MTPLDELEEPQVAVNAVGSTLGFGASAPGEPAGAATRPDTLPPASQISISRLADLLARLDALARTDPAGFREAMRRGAGRLRGEATRASGHEAVDLLHLAARFEATAASGGLGHLLRDRLARAHPHPRPAAGEGEAGQGLLHLLVWGLQVVLGAAGGAAVSDRALSA